MRGVASRRVRRSGLTLVEVCLVLALLVVIGAISAPMLGGSFSRAELHGASDLLRGAWSRGRLAAMESGQTYVFRFEPNGRAYQIVTLSDLGALGAEAVPVEDVEGAVEDKPEDIMRLAKNSLPDGVIFAAGEVSASSQVMATLGAPERRGLVQPGSVPSGRHHLRRLGRAGERCSADDPRHASRSDRQLNHRRRRYGGGGSSMNHLHRRRRRRVRSTRLSLWERPRAIERVRDCTRRHTDCPHPLDSSRPLPKGEARKRLHAAGNHPGAGNPGRFARGAGRSDAAGRSECRR